jgi:hypothetical protein
MQAEPYLELIERRLTLLGELAAALRASTDALVQLDLDAIHRRVGEQERLCVEIQTLDRGLDELRGKYRGAIGLEADPPPALARMAAAQAEVRALNRRHAALVRRSRRTLEAMMNFLRSTAPTYADPGLAGGHGAGRG